MGPVGAILSREVDGPVGAILSWGENGATLRELAREQTQSGAKLRDRVSHRFDSIQLSSEASAGATAPESGMGGTRLELVTSTMSTWRSNQLS